MWKSMLACATHLPLIRAHMLQVDAIIDTFTLEHTIKQMHHRSKHSASERATCTELNSHLSKAHASATPTSACKLPPWPSPADKIYTWNTVGGDEIAGGRVLEGGESMGGVIKVIELMPAQLPWTKRLKNGVLELRLQLGQAREHHSVSFLIHRKDYLNSQILSLARARFSSAYHGTITFRYTGLVHVW